tara:strand:+ start:2823 stop:3233 length:411 start_codon:yes stop_codon:yes gene_type:complete
MIEIARLLVDFGLLILIWMVQLIVYPSFLYYTSKELLSWHDRYTKSLAYIVLPLMLTQLGITIFQMIQAQNMYTITSIVLVLFLWGITLLKFAPMHHQISQGTTHQEFLSSLVKSNWIRTICWTILFVMSLVLGIL